jgi:leucyl-tRNA synthetase
MERTELSKEKTGVFSGLYAINPVTEKEIPIWIADYVLASYGTGAIMAVPSHDERDGAFAGKYNLEVNHEYVPDDGMIEKIVEKGVGEKAVNYHLRDWIFSRQHYWGEPIPMIYCENDGWVSVPEDQLPVRLPEVEKYEPTDTGESPLANITEWVEVTCPVCGGKAKRETDTMPNWAGSDWYFLRYCDPKNNGKLADMEKMEYWMPVDVYCGGDEHNTLHLLYSRFIYQFLWDLGVVPKGVPEPYNKRLSHGVILGPDGNRMSKSHGNVIVPDSVADVNGTDALRTYMMFMGPFDATMAWNERSLVGVRRFIERFFNLITDKKGKYAATDIESMRAIHRLVKGVGEDIAEFKFNTAIAKMMETVNFLTKAQTEIADAELSMMVRILAPFAPFATEEMWSILGGDFSVHTADWPRYEEKYLVSETVTLSVQINGKLRGTVETTPDATQEEVQKVAEAQEKIKKYLFSGTVRKVIYIQGKTINYVVT